jgi:hypothetical protein
MDPSTRFLIILISMFCFFLAVFFLTGAYYVKKGTGLILERKGKFGKVLASGWHYYLPILYEGWGFFQEGEATYCFRRKGYRISFRGTLKDPARYFEGKRTYKALAKNAIKTTSGIEQISLQIKAQLNQNGWEIQSVSIER